MTTDVVIVGGCGRVGLPLGIAFADAGLVVSLFDINGAAVDTVNRGDMPFLEPGTDGPLRLAVDEGRLRASADGAIVGDAAAVVIVIGTAIDEHLNPDPEGILRAVTEMADVLHDDQLLVLRSTIYPGVTGLVERRLEQLGLHLDVAFCPERIAEGKAMVELTELPQIIGARNHRAAQRAETLFRALTTEIVHLEPEEAELAKLYSNVWRYTKFAVANQFFMIANDCGLDYERIRQAMSFRYPRAADLPGAGFAAGPCLFKDTMQLAAFTNNTFVFGHTGMLINEGLPPYLVSKLEQKHDLARLTVGILGMAFKAESDDNRSSLSYKLKRILQMKASRVLCTDPFVGNDPDLTSLETVLTESDLLIIGAPHETYRLLDTHKPVVDVWNLRGNGVRI